MRALLATLVLLLATTAGCLAGDEADTRPRSPPREYGDPEATAPTGPTGGAGSQGGRSTTAPTSGSGGPQHSSDGNHSATGDPPEQWGLGSEGSDDGGVGSDPSSCGEEPFAAPRGGPYAGATALDAALAHVQRLADGNAEAYMRMVHVDYVDVLAGEQEPEPWPCRLHDLRAALPTMEGVGQGRSALQLVDLQNATVLPHSEYWDPVNRTVIGAAVPFVPQTSDVLVIVEGRGLEPVPFGWYALYRPAQDGWLMTATPF